MIAAPLAAAALLYRRQAAAAARIGAAPRRDLQFTLAADARVYAAKHQTTMSRRSTTLGRAADTSGERPELRVPAPPTSAAVADSLAAAALPPGGAVALSPPVPSGPAVAAGAVPGCGGTSPREVCL